MAMDIEKTIRELKEQYNESFTCTQGSSLGTYAVEEGEGYTDVSIAKEEEVEVSGYSFFAVETSSWSPKIRMNPRCKYLNSNDHGSSANDLECTNLKRDSRISFNYCTCSHARVFDVSNDD